MFFFKCVNLKQVGNKDLCWNKNFYINTNEVKNVNYNSNLFLIKLWNEFRVFGRINIELRQYLFVISNCTIISFKIEFIFPFSQNADIYVNNLTIFINKFLIILWITICIFNNFNNIYVFVILVIIF